MYIEIYVRMYLCTMYTYTHSLSHTQTQASFDSFWRS